MPLILCRPPADALCRRSHGWTAGVDAAHHPGEHELRHGTVRIQFRGFHQTVHDGVILVAEPVDECLHREGLRARIRPSGRLAEQSEEATRVSLRVLALFEHAGQQGGRLFPKRFALIYFNMLYYVACW